MASSNNVVNLLDTLSEQTGSSNTLSDQELPELLKSTKRIATQQLELLLNKMFNNADDCLFEYAEKAQNNQQQSQYFDAMRELRLRKDYIRQHFFSSFEKSFTQAYLSPAKLSSRMNSHSELDSLSLVEEDALEESLAITHMTQRIFTDCRESLAGMIIRFNELAEHHKFSKDANPLSPDIICNSFHDATKCLTPIIEIKLIVFKLFDKFVVQNIACLYNDINALLISAGVLPTIKYSISTSEQTQSATNATTIKQTDMPVNSDVTTQSASTYDSYDSIRNALHQYQSSGQQNAAVIGQSAVGGVAEGMVGGVNSQLVNRTTIDAQRGTGFLGSNDNTPYYYVSNDIIDGLSRLQTNNEFTGADTVLATQANSDIIKSGIVKDIAHFSSDQHAKDIGRNEADIVDIVSMMFDYVLNDSRLPDSIKYSIGRLQIPIVKVAILDNTFFSKKNHPARELLNELSIADSDINTSSTFDDKLFEKINYITQSILDTFEQDTQIFEDLLIEFREFIESARQADQLAKEILLYTRNTVASELRSRLKDEQIPNAVRQFLLGPWKDVLNIVAIKDSCEGDNWNLFIGFMDNLLWSIQDKNDAEERALLTEQIPVLLLVIQEGLKQSNKRQKEVQVFLKALEKLHFKALRANLSEMVDSSDTPSPQMQQPSHADAILDSSNKTIMDNVLVETAKHKTFKQDLSDPELNTNPHFDLVNRMPLETWVEFHTDTDSHKGKLIWKSSFTGDYVFMSRNEKPIVDISMRDLIQLFEDGSASVVNTVPILDQAIESVIKTLRNCVGGGKSASPVVH